MLYLRSFALCAAALFSATHAQPVGAQQNAQPAPQIDAASRAQFPAKPAVNQNDHPAAALKAQADQQAQYGAFLLGIGELDTAKSECESALKTDPTNQNARKCLNDWAATFIDDKLNAADGDLLQGEAGAALKTASPWVHSRGSANQRGRAAQIVQRAKTPWVNGLWKAIPGWLQQIIITVVFLLCSVLLTNVLRWSWRKGRSLRIGGFVARKTVWRLQPLTQLNGSSEGVKATDGLLDALARLGDELDRDVWEPNLLLLRPTPPANFEPALISDFLIHTDQPGLQSDCAVHSMILFPAMKNLRAELDYHEVRMDDALKDLQLKAAGGIDAGALLRFLMAVWRWITAGSPTISGSVEMDAVTSDVHAEAEKGSTADGSRAANGSEKAISLHIAAHGIGVPTVSITTSNNIQAGIDCVQLAAERAAFKFLVRMRYPEMTNDEVNGLAALRQGAQLFAEFASTCPGGGSAAITRISALRSAACNLEFSRSAVPPAYVTAMEIESSATVPGAGPNAPALGNPPAAKAASSSSPTSPPQRSRSHLSSAAETFGITDEMRQAALLAEGVAHALAGADADLDAAVSCFRQLQEWPGTDKQSPIWQQAAYNEAIVNRAMASYGQCVLMLTEFLGDPVPDLGPRSQLKLSGMPNEVKLVKPVQLAARVARLSAFAQYTSDDWETLPPNRTKLLIDDAEKLVTDLETLLRSQESVHDSRMVRYLLGETLRSIGHVELRRVIQDLGADRIYDDDNRPTKLLTQPLDPAKENEKLAQMRLERSIECMKTCEEFNPSGGLFCDISETFLLLSKFREAQGYARHATLKVNPAPGTCEKIDFDPLYERAYYLAAESFFVNNKPELASRYAQLFAGTVTSDEFKALRKVLGI
jgi:hypothetical protein